MTVPHLNHFPIPLPPHEAAAPHAAASALQDALDGFTRARDHLGNLRGQLARSEAEFYAQAIESGLAVTAAREQVKYRTSSLIDEIATAEAHVDVWRARLTATTTSIQYLLGL